MNYRSADKIGEFTIQRNQRYLKNSNFRDISCEVGRKCSMKKKTRQYHGTVPRKFGVGKPALRTQDILTSYNHLVGIRTRNISQLCFNILMKCCFVIYCSCLNSQYKRPTYILQSKNSLDMFWQLIEKALRTEYYRATGGVRATWLWDFRGWTSHGAVSGFNRYVGGEYTEGYYLIHFVLWILTILENKTHLFLKQVTTQLATGPV
jgi:hypothetical protein